MYWSTVKYVHTLKGVFLNILSNRQAEDTLERIEQLSTRVTNTTDVANAVAIVKKKLEEMIVFASVVQNQSAQAMVGNKHNKEYLYSVNVITHLWN